MPKQRLAARRVGGRWVVEIARQVESTLEQTAVALARMAPRGPVGEETIRKACRAAAVGAFGERAPDGASVETYRRELERDGLFARVAKVRRPGAEPTYLVFLPEHYELERAAEALAAHFEVRPRKQGHRTAQRALIRITNPERAGGPGMPEATADEPDPQEVAFWRGLLIREFGFPADPA